MRKKIRVAILFGGKSAEHEVSVRSAKSIAGAIDKKKYEPVFIGLDKNGRWLSPRESALILNGSQWPIRNTKNFALFPQENGKITSRHQDKIDLSVDVVFPVLHGPLGEDGTMQGLLKLLNIPFVGAGVLGSAVGMDKDVMKRLLREANIPVAKFIVYRKNEIKDISFSTLQKKLGVPFFVKPANLGSSVGISKVHNRSELKRAITEAFTYDLKILVEEYIRGREIECSILGNEKIMTSLPGEIIPQHEFYSYEAKYLDENGALLKIPAKLSKFLIRKIQRMSVRVYKILCCEGMARVDFFLTSRNRILVNEINTIPGFTSISMFPKLWEASGVSYPKLISALIELALDRSKKERQLKIVR